MKIVPATCGSAPAIDGLGTYSNILDALRSLYKDPAGFETLIVDTLDSLEPLILEHICAQRGWKDIETPPYGKGFVAADETWRSFSGD